MVLRTPDTAIYFVRFPGWYNRKKNTATSSTIIYGHRQHLELLLVLLESLEAFPSPRDRALICGGGFSLRCESGF